MNWGKVIEYGLSFLSGFHGGFRRGSDRWYESLSDSDLDNEREKIRFTWANSSENPEERYELKRRLNDVDKLIASRNSKTRTKDDGGHTYRTEHGWYLPEDE